MLSIKAVNIKSYNKNGYLIIRSALSKNECEYFKKKTKNLKPKLKIPYRDVAWGYGNLINTEPFNKVLDKKFLTDAAKKIIGSNFIYNHLLINNKAAWLGPDVEFHQEVYNMQTYAPGSVPKKDWKKFMQIFIALDKQSKENGCLKIIPKSHKLGILKCEDAIGSNLGHKRRTVLKDLNKAYKKFGIKDLELNQGDAVIFNHLLIHGSANNVSAKGRMAMLLQARMNFLKKNNRILKKETKYRTDFVIKNLNNKITSLKKRDLYKDFSLKK